MTRASLSLYPSLSLNLHLTPPTMLICLACHVPSMSHATFPVNCLVDHFAALCRRENEQHTMGCTRHQLNINQARRTKIQPRRLKEYGHRRMRCETGVQFFPTVGGKNTYTHTHTHTASNTPHATRLHRPSIHHIGRADTSCQLSGDLDLCLSQLRILI